MSTFLKQNSLRACRNLLATDLANVYTHFIDAFPDINMATIENFGPLFDKDRLEYLHYSGNSTLDCPYHEWVIEELLQLSAAYLYFPLEIVDPHVRRFGFLLTFYFYFTQPAMSNQSGLAPTRVRIALHLINEVLDKNCRRDMVSKSRLDDNYTDLNTNYKSEEMRIMLTMQKYRGWQLALYDHGVGERIEALIQAHEKKGVLLLSSQHPTSSSQARFRPLSARLNSRHTQAQSPVFVNQVDFNSPRKRKPLEFPELGAASFSSPVDGMRGQPDIHLSYGLLKEINEYEQMKRRLGLDFVFAEKK